MGTVRIRKTIDSATIHLPELVPFLGHTVDIVIEERTIGNDAVSPVIAGNGNWDAFREAAQALRPSYDYDAVC